MMDIKACAAVREAVGPEFPLMLDANHWYSRMEAYELGKGIRDRYVGRLKPRIIITWRQAVPKHLVLEEHHGYQA